MLNSPLFLPDRPEWRFEPDYSLTASAALREAYTLLAHASAHASSQAVPWSQVHETLSPVVTQRMSRPQHRNVYFLLGMTQASLNRYDEALASLENACALSVELEDVTAIADISFLCGCLTRDQLHLSTATHYFEVSVTAFAQLPDPFQPESADKAFNTWIQLAFVSFYQAHFDETATHLEKARQLLPRTSLQSQGRADIQWIEALLSRWRGDRENGLRQAQAFAEVIAQQAAPPTVVRAWLLVADLALDCAESFLPDMRRATTPFVTLATPYIRDALSLARSAQDFAGLGLALLADARLSRVEGRDSPRVETIEHVFDMARQIGDIALLAQAHTALGDEFRFAGEKDAAVACYRTSLAALEPSDITALGVWPRQAMLRLVNANDD
jgi:tetratricopeptide (TPR) repeat protein